MANKNQNNEGKVTAGELLDKLLGKKSSTADASENSGDSVSDEKRTENGFSENGFSIDVSTEDESDSELDINELLKKYMPEYGEDAEDDLPQGGVISGLKQSVDYEEDDLPYGMEDGFTGEEDDSLISALDSAFDSEGGGEFDFVGDDLNEDPSEWEDDADSRPRKRKEKKDKKPFFLFGFGRRGKSRGQEEETDEFAAELDRNNVDERSAEVDSDEDTVPNSTSSFDDEFDALTLSDDDMRFHTTDARLGSIDEIDTAVQDAKSSNRSTPEMRKAAKDGKAVSSDTAATPESEDGVEELLSFITGDESDAAADDLFDVSEFGEFPVDENGDDEKAAMIGGDTVDEDQSAEEEIDPTDLNLRVAFGLDEGEQQSSGTAAKQLGDELEAKQYRREKRAKLDRQEFVDKTQIPKIRKEQHGRIISLWVKLGLCVVFSAALLWFENIAFFTDLFTGTAQQFAGAFDPAVYPVVYIMTSLQLMLLACLCAYEQIIDGFKCLFRGIPRAESLLSFLAVTGIIYSAVLARLIETPNEPVMFNFVVALAAVLSLVYAIYNTKREKMNFDIVSSKKTKYTMHRLPDEESMSQAQAFMEQTDACDVMKIEKTDFIDGFFGRLYQPDSTVTILMTCMMSAAAALAVLAGFFVSMKGGSSVDVLRVGYMTLLVSAPVFTLVAFSYPFYRATKAANEYNCAIIGEASLSEYSDASIISFDDKNVFPSYSVKIQNIKIYNNARVDRVLYYAASVFSHAGGPLQDVFEVATLEMGHSEDVKIFDTEAGFLATQVNGVNIIFGSYNKLTEKGFVIPEENASDDIDFSSELSLMYMFREDKLVAKMYIKYVMDGDIDLILKQFQGTGLYVCVRTFDPNIDERMIAKKLNMRRIPLKVVRYANTDEVTKYEEKVDSGLVTNASPKSLLQVISYCDKVLHTRKANIALGVLSVLIGIAIICLMIVSGTAGMVTSLFVAVYHLLWILPMILFAKVFIR